MYRSVSGAVSRRPPTVGGGTSTNEGENIQMKMSSTSAKLVAALMAGTLVLAACGSDDTSGSSDTTTPTTAAPTETTSGATDTTSGGTDTTTGGSGLSADVQ